MEKEKKKAPAVSLEKGEEGKARKKFEASEGENVFNKQRGGGAGGMGGKRGYRKTTERA